MLASDWRAADEGVGELGVCQSIPAIRVMIWMYVSATFVVIAVENPVTDLLAVGNLRLLI
jgi:hypothetical protein